MEEKDNNEVAFMDVTIYDDGKCYIEVSDNGHLAKNIAMAMIKDDTVLSILAEAYIIYQEKIGQLNTITKNKIVN